ncbi:uncharacterized protein LOC112600102 [Melanaphis sacchari]|uniref:uncharacterized protein LOC112600102 n=1 Tax=Melanaphis sacchari TaxID=742174 RepID=UPI000DC13011|nr:uncharacterized protein LOC112600102 [Melanaphis sacchari]
MHRLANFWLPLALVTLMVSPCAIGTFTKPQLRKLISMILYEDQQFNDVLSEMVKLNDIDQTLSPFLNEKVPDIKNVNPLVSLFALTSTHPYYSGDDLNLSVTILSTSIMCLTHKRVALHLALIIRLIEQIDGQAHFQIRSRVFTHAVPLYMDMLLSVHGNADNLLAVYNIIFDMMSSLDSGETVEYDDKVNTLKQELEKLNAVIESSCVVNKMKDYCDSFKLSKLENCASFITDNQLISDGVDVNTTVESLKENENAIMNLFDEMDLLRNVDRGVWKVMLKIPDLPADDPSQFKRTELPTYRDEVEDIIYRKKLSMSDVVKIEHTPVTDPEVDVVVLEG